MRPEILWTYLGEVAYGSALSLQRELHAWCRAKRSHILLLVQHPPTVTLGYRMGEDQCRLSPQELQRLGIDLFLTERGGGATYHGPGQLVAYPVFFLPAWGLGVRSFVWSLEEVMIRVAEAYGVRAGRKPGYPGVWVGEEKLGALGIAVKNRVSLHGFALNIDLDLTPFSYIFPCGLRDKGVTSLRLHATRPVPVAEVVQGSVRAFAQVFHAHLEEVSYGKAGFGPYPKRGQMGDPQSSRKAQRPRPPYHPCPEGCPAGQ